MIQRRNEIIHEGKYAAEVPVELIEEEGGWSPYFSFEDAQNWKRYALPASRRHCRSRQIWSRVRADAGGGEVSKIVDWVIDLDPKVGDGGGQIIAVGAPEDIAREKHRYTGRFAGAANNRRAGPPGQEAGKIATGPG